MEQRGHALRVSTVEHVPWLPGVQEPAADRFHFPEETCHDRPSWHRKGPDSYSHSLLSHEGDGFEK